MVGCPAPFVSSALLLPDEGPPIPVPEEGGWDGDELTLPLIFAEAMNQTFSPEDGSLKIRIASVLYEMDEAASEWIDEYTYICRFQITGTKETSGRIFFTQLPGAFKTLAGEWYPDFEVATFHSV